MKRVEIRQVLRAVKIRSPRVYDGRRRRRRRRDCKRLRHIIVLRVVQYLGTILLYILCTSSVVNRSAPMTVQGPRNDVISVTIYDTAPPVESVYYYGRPTKKKN